METIKPIQLLNANICDGQLWYRRVSWDGSGSSEFEYDEEGQIIGCPRWECPAQITELWTNCQNAEKHTTGRGKNKSVPWILIDGHIFSMTGRGRHNVRKQKNGYVLKCQELGIEALIICDPYNDDPEALTVKFMATFCAQTTQQERGTALLTISAMLGLTTTPPTAAITTPNKAKEWAQDTNWRCKELSPWQWSSIDIANDIEVSRPATHEDWNPPGHPQGAAVITKARPTQHTNTDPVKSQQARPAVNVTFGKKGQSLITTTFYDKIEELRSKALENPDIAMNKIRAYNIPEKYHPYIMHQTSDHPGTSIIRCENTANREWLTGMAWRNAWDAEQHWTELLSSINVRRVTTPNLSDHTRSRWETADFYKPIEALGETLPPPRRLVEQFPYEDLLGTRILEGHLHSQMCMERAGWNSAMTIKETAAALGRAYQMWPAIKPTPVTNNSKFRRLDKLEAFLQETDVTHNTGAEILKRAMANAFSATANEFSIKVFIGETDVTNNTPEEILAIANAFSGCDILNRTPTDAGQDQNKPSAYANPQPPG